MSALEDGSPVVDVIERDLLFASPIKNDLLVLFAQLTEGGVDRKVVVIRQ